MKPGVIMLVLPSGIGSNSLLSDSASSLSASIFDSDLLITFASGFLIVVWVTKVPEEFWYDRSAAARIPYPTRLLKLEIKLSASSCEACYRFSFNLSASR